MRSFWIVIFFIFNASATTEIYTLSLHDALPIYFWEVDIDQGDIRFRPGNVLHRVFTGGIRRRATDPGGAIQQVEEAFPRLDRKSTRLNSSHTVISYAVFCLKKKKVAERDGDVHV